MSSEPPNARRLLGEFRELEHGRPDGPSLRAAVRDQAGPDELRLAHYLRSGAVLAATGSRVHDVLSPDQEPIDGLRLHTDGQWFWYSDLAHYVEQYHVALDEHFAQHARDQDFVPPQLSTTDLIKIEQTLFDNEDS
ncbi:hypothetical protein [Streptomyces sp. NBC_01262]|uniref:hypothetical protein n=1 Tax=Streptomyces sp. NBC_01262 TaxID=2903803 RepID=UPI002E2F0970|nr:hypothetical protein [Streptomyces sp. NBC_01262]